MLVTVTEGTGTLVHVVDVESASVRQVVKFAVPTVQVSGERELDVDAAAARYAAHSRARDEPAA